MGGYQETRASSRFSLRARPLSAGGVAIVGAIGFVLAALLNSASLVRMADRMPLDSSLRGSARSATHALQRVARVVALDRPGRKIDAWRGKDQGGSGTFTTTSTTSTTVDPGAGPTDSTVPGDNVDPSASSTTAAASPSATRVPTTSDKYKLYIAGDSQAHDFGQALERLSGKTGLIDPTLDFKVSSGLVRPDFFDWPKHLEEQVGKLRPDIVVIDFGGNDTQGIQLDDGAAIQDVLSPEWSVEYARRVGKVMDFLTQGGRKLIWVGVPNAVDDQQTAHLAVLRKVYQDEVAKRPDVTFVDPWPLFESPQHRYADYVADDDGQVRQMRQSDGFHLSFDGANRLARHIETEVERVLVARGAKLG